MKYAKYAKKTVRRAEIGWKNLTPVVRNVVVGPSKGGGTRHFELLGSTTMPELMQRCLVVFGAEETSEIQRKLPSFDDHPLTDDVTVSQLCETKEVTLLRVYLLAYSQTHHNVLMMVVCNKALKLLFATIHMRRSKGGGHTRRPPPLSLEGKRFFFNLSFTEHDSG